MPPKGLLRWSHCDLSSPLLTSFADPDQRLTSGLLVPLSTLEREQTQELREVWPEIDATRRVRILNELATLAEDNVDLNFDPIFTGPPEGRAGLRLAGLRGLIEYEGRDLIAALATMLREDADLDVRSEAAMALGRYALEAELGHLYDSDREAIADILMESAEDNDEDIGVRAKAIEALGAMSDEEIDNLIESIYDEESI